MGDPAPPSLKGHSPQVLANVHCGQTVGWTKMPLCMEVGLGPGDFVFNGDPAPPRKKGHSPGPLLTPNFWPLYKTIKSTLYVFIVSAAHCLHHDSLMRRRA